MRGLTVAALYVLIGVLVQDLVFDIPVLMGDTSLNSIMAARAFHQGVQKEPFRVTLVVVGLLIATFSITSFYSVFIRGSRNPFDLVLVAGTFTLAPLFVLFTFPAEQELVRGVGGAEFGSVQWESASCITHTYAATRERGIELVKMIGYTHLAMVALAVVGLLLDRIFPPTSKQQNKKTK